MSLSRVSLPLAALLLLPLACTTDPPAQTGDDEQAKTEPKTEPSDAKPADPNELTPEDLRLIAADPKDLGPDENRKRAYALRKKVMQNPDSPQAKALEEAREAALAGQAGTIAPPPKGPTMNENGLVIPAPDHLKNQDQSYGKPAE